MTTPLLPAPNRPYDDDPLYDLDTPRGPKILGLVFLVVGFGIDLAAFSGALMVLDGQMNSGLAIAIAVGASLMALFLMFEAGHLEARRRNRTKSKHGRGLINTLIWVWLMAGVGATFIRLTVEPDSGASGDPFQSGGASVADPFAGTAGSADPFVPAADAVGAAPRGAIDIGIATIYPEHVPMALFMLVLYLGVGVSAFATGLHFHNPRARALRKKQRALAEERKALDALRAREDEAAGKDASLRAAEAEADRAEQRLDALRTLEASLVDLGEARMEHDRLAVRQADLNQRRSRLEVDLDHLPGRATEEKRAATESGRIAGAHARAVLHRALGEPARTVMDDDAGPELTTHTEA